MLSPPILVVTRTRNRPKFLDRAMRSVLGQRCEDWQHVIVNDGGDREQTEQVAAPHREAYRGRLEILHRDAALGMQGAANEGISSRESEFVVIHDDDDSWDPDFLQSCLDFLREKGPDSPYQGVITQTLLIGERVQSDGTITEIERSPYRPLDEISLFRFGFENPFPPIAFCFRRTAWQALGGFDPRYTVAGDYDFNFRFAQRYEIGVIPRPSAHYHVRVDDFSSGPEANSVTAAGPEHKLRYNELHNHHLRGDDPQVDRFTGLALNLSRYLVEIEWAVHEARKRAARLEDGFDELRPQLLKGTENLWKDLNTLARELKAQHQALAQNLDRHAENLWTDLNTRARELAASLEEMRAQQRSLERKVDRANRQIFRLGPLALTWRRTKGKRGPDSSK